MDNWEVAKLYPQEMKVLSRINQHLCFQWKVGLTYIIGNFKNPLVSREQLNKQGVIQ